MPSASAQGLSLSNGITPTLKKFSASCNLCNLFNSSTSLVGKRTNNVAKDERVIVLAGLVDSKRRIRAGGRIELVFANVYDPGRIASEESLYSNDVNCIDHGVGIHISSR